MTQQQINARQREYRNRTKNLSTIKYEKTVNGFLVRLYRNMKSRISGVQKLKHHLYKNKELLNKDDFYAWAKSSPDFNLLFNNWTDSHYDRKLTPSVDRVDSSVGYLLSNMVWVTHSENSRRGSISQWRNKAA